MGGGIFLGFSYRLDRGRYNMKFQNIVSLGLFGLVLIAAVCAEQTEDAAEQEEKVEVDNEKLDYAKGSLCGYCDYCKFCTLCEEDCPCEKSAKQPNCHMCKYCKYCYLCKACDAVCQPGGFLDRVTASIVNALPSINKEEVQEDLDGVKEWIDKTKDEL